MSFIAENGLIHGDIKPANILVSYRDGRLRAFVGDFGLTDKSGGTPIFMAPEGLEKDSRVVEKTDLYSFAITSLFLIFRTDLAIKLLFLPLSTNVGEFRKSLSNFPLLDLIFNTLKTDCEKRPGFEIWKKFLGETEICAEKISPKILEKLGVELGPLKSAEEREMGAIFEILHYFNFSVESRRVNENFAWPMSAALSHLQNLSMGTLNKASNMLSKGSSIAFEIFCA